MNQTKPLYNIANLPDRKTLDKVTSALRSADLSKVSYQKVLYSLLNDLKVIPFVIAKLKAGHHIERARINEPNQLFYSEKEISYRTDFQNIKSYGRANSPGQSLFYGAVKTENIEHPRIINLLETSEMFRSADRKRDAEFVMTVGKWRIREDFEVIESVFNKHNIQTIPQIKQSYEYYLNKLKAEMPDRIDDIEFLLEFFSDEFAKKEIKSGDDYKISAAYTELAMNFHNVAGVAYPSVRTDYQGFNVALGIYAVENFLELEVAAMFKIYKKGEQTFMDNLAYATDLGEMKSDFKWIDIKGTPEDFINEHLLKN
ncbi:hypothetical protein ACTHQF_00215 [Pedobacter sp. SAFR-022]|uniref:hypothetical protein n=1 Tax=Pedobacter sp. SAFR-022 TaxID=3436861 RepID=UPI003F7FD7FC